MKGANKAVEHYAAKRGEVHRRRYWKAKLGSVSTRAGCEPDCSGGSSRDMPKGRLQPAGAPWAPEVLLRRVQQDRQPPQRGRALPRQSRGLSSRPPRQVRTPHLPLLRSILPLRGPVEPSLRGVRTELFRTGVALQGSPRQFRRSAPRATQRGRARTEAR